MNCGCFFSVTHALFTVRWKMNGKCINIMKGISWFVNANGRKMLTSCRHFLGIPISNIVQYMFQPTHTHKQTKPFLCGVAGFRIYIDSKTELLFWICWTISDKILTDILANILTFRMVTLLISISIQFNSIGFIKACIRNHIEAARSW